MNKPLGNRALGVAVAAAACNWAPTPYPDPSIAPGGRAPWSHPTETACDDRADPDAFVVDGFSFCARSEGLGKTPIDDPIYVRCDEVPAETAKVTVFSAFNGVRARAYVISELLGREVVNDDWDGEPLLVDY